MPITFTPAPIAAPTKTTSVGPPLISMSTSATTAAKNITTNATAVRAAGSAHIAAARITQRMGEFRSLRFTEVGWRNNLVEGISYNRSAFFKKTLTFRQKRRIFCRNFLLDGTRPSRLRNPSFDAYDSRVGLCHLDPMSCLTLDECQGEPFFLLEGI